MCQISFEIKNKKGRKRKFRLPNGNEQKLEKKLGNTVSCDVFVNKIEQFMRLSGFTISILVDEKLMNFKTAHFFQQMRVILVMSYDIM